MKYHYADHHSVRVDADSSGPELTSRHFLAWCIERKIELVHIEPGKPTQNPHVESFHGRLREECLSVSWFRNLFDARKKIADWHREYNQERPHSSLKLSDPGRVCSGTEAVEKTRAARLENDQSVSHSSGGC